jgi:hypothetical protein
MIINDLNYLETVSEEVVGGFTATKNVAIKVNVNEVVSIKKNVASNVDISGNLATAESGATALGNNTLAESFAFTNTTGNSSSANAFSVSGTM